MADVSVTTTAVKQVVGSTQVDTGIAGEAVAAGKVLYKNANDSNKLYLADANAALATAQAVGVAMHAASTDQPIEYATGGDLDMSGLTVALVYIVSATAGGIAPVADLTTGWYSSVLGVALSSTRLRLKPILSNVPAV